MNPLICSFLIATVLSVYSSNGINLQITVTSDLIQQEIDSHQIEILAFIQEIKTVKDLYLPLPIPSRQSAPRIPALIDLMNKRRNLHLIEKIIAKKLPLECFLWRDCGLFDQWASTAPCKSKVIAAICQLCIDHKCNLPALLNADTLTGHTPLMMVSIAGKTACVKTLLKYGALVNQVNAHYETALHLVVRRWRRRSNGKTNKIVTMLCAAGIDLTLKNKNNQTAKEIAIEDGYRDTAYIIECYENTQHLKSFSSAISYFSLLPLNLVRDTLINCVFENRSISKR